MLLKSVVILLLLLPIMLLLLLLISLLRASPSSGNDSFCFLSFQFETIFFNRDFVFSSAFLLEQLLICLMIGYCNKCKREKHKYMRTGKYFVVKLLLINFDDWKII